MSNHNSAWILHAPETKPFRDLPMSLKGYPSQIEGHPVHYRKKEVMRAGKYVHPTKGWELSVDQARMDGWIRNFKTLGETVGYKPFVPTKHKDFDSKDNRGYVIALEREGDSLYAVEQLIGDDALRDSARNEQSVCIRNDFKARDGKVYDEVLEHVAFCPDPVATGLGGFIALSASASGGPQDIAPVYVMAADRSTAMPLTAEQLQKVQKLPGAKDVTAENAIDKLIELATPLAGIADPVTMSRADKDKLDGELASLRTEKTNLEGRVTELSRSAGDKAPKPPDPEILRDRHENAEDKINLAVARGEMPRAFADKIIGRLGTREQPSVFMLSRQDALGDRPADFILSLFKGEKFGVKVGEETGQQSGTIEFSRQPPQPAGGKKTDEQIGQEAEAEGAKWRDEQLRARGIVTTAAK